MDRLTDDRTAQALRENIEKLKAAGVAIDPSNERYVRLAELERQTEWISVKDRMPEDNVPVLLVWTNGRVTSVIPGWHVSIKGLGSVTHWMPLPEPPKMSEERSRRISAEAEEDRIAAAGIGQAFNPD